MTQLEKAIEEESIKITLQEIDEQIMDVMIQLEMLRETKLRAENRIIYLQTLN